MGLIILSIILLILAILIFSPVKVYVKYFDKKPEIILKYLFFKKILVGEGKKKKLQKKKADKKTEKKEEKSEEKPKKKLLPETTSGKIDFIKNILNTSGHAFKRLTKHIKIKGIYIDIKISDLDACECALKFGKTNILVYNTLSYLGNFVKLKKKSVNIRCVYNEHDCFYKIGFNIRITPVAAIFIAVAFIFRFLVNNIKTKNKTMENQQVNNAT